MEIMQKRERVYQQAGCMLGVCQITLVQAAIVQLTQGFSALVLDRDLLSFIEY